MKSDTGKQVFGENADAVLAQKVVEHTKKNSSTGRTAGRNSRFPHEDLSSTGSTTFIYRTPEQKHEKAKRYGIAALVLLFLLGIITFLWSRVYKR
jgi:hypothetical protein